MKRVLFIIPMVAMVFGCRQSATPSAETAPVSETVQAELTASTTETTTTDADEGVTLLTEHIPPAPETQTTATETRPRTRHTATEKKKRR